MIYIQMKFSEMDKMDKKLLFWIRGFFSNMGLYNL